MEEIQTMKKQIAEIEKLTQGIESDERRDDIDQSEVKYFLKWNLEDARNSLQFALENCRRANNK